MPEANDKSVLGRKIFFINPSFTIENNVIDRLRTMEYEVYAISDYKVAKNIFLTTKDCICFVSPDTTLSKDGWHNFLSHFESDSTFENIDFGVITERLIGTKAEEFSKGLKLSAGMFPMTGIDETVREVVKSLDKLEAKGMRKYVRVSCATDAKAELYWVTKDKKMFRLKLVDISAVAIAAKLPSNQANAVFVNQLISDGYIIFYNKQIPVTAKVSALKPVGDFLLVVLMLTMDTPKASMDQIRAYVNETLQENLEHQIQGFLPDRTNYEVAPRKTPQ